MVLREKEFSKLELMQGRVDFIPDQWRFMHLGKVFDIRNNFRKPISEEERDKIQGEYPYLGPTKIQDYICTFEQDGNYALIGEDGDHFLKYKSQSMTQLIDGKCTVNNHAHIIEGTKKASREWFYYYFMHRDIFSFLTRQGAGRYKLNKASLEKLPVLIPPPKEQKKITQFLSTWDKAITITERLLANSQHQKKALMQQLLTGKKRLPGFSGEWQRVRLGSLSEMNSGGTPKSSIENYYGGDIQWVSIADMTRSGKYIEITKKTLTNLGLENCSAKIYPKDTILYAMYASIGECGIASVELTSSQAILGIRSNENLNHEFLYFYLLSLKEKIKLQGQQGAQSNLNAGMVKGFKIPVPSLEEQNSIVLVLTAADQDIQVINQKLDNLKQEKKALMQQLLTGKRRVKLN